MGQVVQRSEVVAVDWLRAVMAVVGMLCLRWLLLGVASQWGRVGPGELLLAAVAAGAVGVFILGYAFFPLSLVSAALLVWLVLAAAYRTARRAADGVPEEDAVRRGVLVPFAVVAALEVSWLVTLNVLPQEPVNEPIITVVEMSGSVVFLLLVWWVLRWGIRPPQAAWSPRST